MDHLRKLRHDLRGGLNALKLCIAVLELPLKSEESVGFLDEIAGTSDTMEGLLRRLESLPDSCWTGAVEPVTFSLSHTAQGSSS